MRRFEKGPEPEALRVLRRTPGASWSSVYGDQKAEIRAAALRDQQGLCAYCNRRVPDDPTTKVEHWSARNTQGGSSDPFEWEHLLAVCPGSAGAPQASQTCDTRRGNRTLVLHPARRPPDTDAAVRFLADGRATADSPALQFEVDEVLGLNTALLRQSRKEAIDAALAKINETRPLPVADRRRALQRLLEPYERAAGQLAPFPNAVLPWLRAALERADALGRRKRKTGNQRST